MPVCVERKKVVPHGSETTEWECELDLRVGISPAKPLARSESQCCKVQGEACWKVWEDAVCTD